jgi:hypothetical protein
MLKPKATTSPDAVDRAKEPWRTKLGRGLGLVIIIGLLFAGLIALGFWLRQQVRPLQAYSLRFDQIDCPDPPGRKHQEFLGEVRYLGELPEELALLDESTVQRVAGAFGKHPWVGKVVRVDFDQRRPRVQLVFRTPVLAVAQEESGIMRVRMVDAGAMVLPADAREDGLPRYRAPDGTPVGPAGQSCPDRDIKAAASTAGYLHDFLAPWRIVGLQMDSSGLVLTSMDGTRILWGHAPGLELATEAPAGGKRDWLRTYFESRDAATERPAAALLDVRGPTEMTVQPIPVVGTKRR